MPERVQLKRTKGWRMPPNTVKVDRTTRWGNPWKIGEFGPMDRCAPDAEGATGLFRMMLGDSEMRRNAGYPLDISPLHGRNLACWCPLPAAGKPDYCHAAVLLEFANAASPFQVTGDNNAG